jgi:ATP adenylyltransferase
MKQLWSPWRKKYVTTAGSLDHCIFCDALAGPDDDESLVVHRTEGAFAVMNLYPYNAGHLMVAPERHVGELGELHDDTMLQIMKLVQRAEALLTERYHPKGFNVGMNLGRVSGAGIPGHLHVHVVPRWEGDTNFMTVLSDVRVISEDVREAARALRTLFSSDAGKA